MAQGPLSSQDFDFIAPGLYVLNIVVLRISAYQLDLEIPSCAYPCEYHRNTTG